MNKFYLNYLLILFISLLTIISCSTDDEIIESTQKIEEKNTFAIFSQSSKIQRKTSSPSVDYANGFSILMQRYDSIHKTNISGLVNTPNVIEHKNKSHQNIIVENKDFYIETRLHSQTIFDENGDIWVMYPRIKNNFVDGLLIARYVDNGTNVFFNYVKPNSDLYTTNRLLFQKAYDEKINSFKQKKNDDYLCGLYDICDLGEVVITPKPKPESCPLCQTSMPENPNGGCSQFEECLYNDPSGGGGGSPIIDACLQLLLNNIAAKGLLEDPEVKEALKKIKEGLPLDEKEKYFLIAKYNKSGLIKTTPIIEGNVGNTGNINVGQSDTYNILGGVHSHTDNYFSAPSPGDFYFLSGANINSPSFSFWYTVAHNGDTYVLYISDYHRFIKFQENFPKDLYLDGAGWKEGTSIHSDFTDVYDNFIINGKSDNEAYYLAMSFVSNKYNMGIGIGKQDSEGNFNSTFVNESKDQSNGKKEFSESENCNLN